MIELRRRKKLVIKNYCMLIENIGSMLRRSIDKYLGRREVYILSL